MENGSEPLETATVASTQPRGTALPFIVYFLLLLLVDGLGFAVSRKDPPEFLMVPLISVLYGQTALALVVGGLMGRNWLEGVYLSTFAVICQFAIGGLSSDSLSEESLLYAAKIPLVCLMGAFPLILFRWTVGWQLRTETMETLPRSRITIEDLILVPASFVAFWVMALAPIDADSNDEFWNSMLEPILPLMGVCALLILPCTFWAFRIQDSGSRWAVCMGYPLLFSIVTSLDIRKTSLRPDDLELSPSVEVIVSKGQFTGSELQDIKLEGLIVKEVAD